MTDILQDAAATDARAMVREGMRNLFFGIAPERRDESQTLWDDLQVEFCLLSDEGGVTLAGGAYRYVHFNHRALRVMWVCAFAAWEGYAAVHSTLVEDGNAVRHGRFRTLLQLAIEIREAPDPEAVSLQGLPEPGHLPNPALAPEMRAAAELAMFAAGWAILHEVRHLRHQQEGTSCEQDAAPQEAWKEEHSCDQFATEFLLQQVDAYCAGSGEPVDLVQRKRRLGIYFAGFALVVLSHPKWDATDTHPAVQDRLQALRRQLMPGQPDDAFCIAMLAFSALKAEWPAAPGIAEDPHAPGGVIPGACSGDDAAGIGRP